MLIPDIVDAVRATLHSSKANTRSESKSRMTRGAGVGSSSRSISIFSEAFPWWGVFASRSKALPQQALGMMAGNGRTEGWKSEMQISRDSRAAKPPSLIPRPYTCFPASLTPSSSSIPLNETLRIYLALRVSLHLSGLALPTGIFLHPLFFLPVASFLQALNFQGSKIRVE